jgi:hypothetical protein
MSKINDMHVVVSTPKNHKSRTVKCSLQSSLKSSVIERQWQVGHEVKIGQEIKKGMPESRNGFGLNRQSMLRSRKAIYQE